jgi:hypothetical protein
LKLPRKARTSGAPTAAARALAAVGAPTGSTVQSGWPGIAGVVVP